MLGACAALWRARRVLLALALGSSNLAAAELDYRAPSGCPSREELSFRIERTLGRPLSQAAAARFDVSVHAANGGYAATLLFQEAKAGPQRERQLGARTCSELVDALSVAIVLAIGTLEAPSEESIEQALPTAGSGAEPAPVAAAPAEPLPAPPEVIPPAAEPHAVPALRPGVFLLLLGDVGSLPAAAVGVALGGGLALGDWRLRGGVHAFLEQHVQLPDGAAPTSGADLSLLFGSLSGCYAAAGDLQSRGALAVCVSGELGQLSGQGTRVRNGQPRQSLWLAAAGGLEGRWSLAGGLYLDAQLGLCFPLNHDEFVLGDAGQVHRPANLAGRGAIGLGWDWQ